MKILWIDLNSSYAHSSLALPALHAQIADDTSIEWASVSATINENIGTIVEEAYRHKPDILAATAWLFNHEQLLHITSRLKALLPETCLILGGPEFLGDNEFFLRKNPFVNCVFRGEGEEAFPRWLSCWNHPEQWNTISGLCFLDSDAQYRDNGTARVLNFSGLIPPEKSRFFNWSKPFVQLETTRGCFNTCAFCVSGGEKPIRTLSIDSIRRRLQIIHEHGIKNVRVLDRTFNYNARRAKELLQLFLEFPDIRFHLEIHPALLSEELKEELRRLPQGLLHLEAGIQSLREPVLKQSRRMGKLSDALAGLEFLCSLPNMETHADLIAGLPLYHLNEIFEDVYTLAGYNAGEIQLESLKLLPGTEMRRQAETLGIHYSPFPPYEVLETNEISVGELQTARQLSRLLDGFYNDANHDHMVMPGMVYISHPTEYGTLYTLEELTELSNVCRKNHIPLYMDGARLAYALACSENQLTLADIARLCDIFYIGGTKCGALFGEAVVIPKPGLIPHFFTIIKQHGALLAKGRLLGIQFDTLFTDSLYEKVGAPAIQAADQIRKTLKEQNFSLCFGSPTNQVFCIVDDALMTRLEKQVEFGFWEKYDDTHTVIRFATSWATTKEDVDALCNLLCNL